MKVEWHPSGTQGTDEIEGCWLTITPRDGFPDGRVYADIEITTELSASFPSEAEVDWEVWHAEAEKVAGLVLALMDRAHAHQRNPKRDSEPEDGEND